MTKPNAAASSAPPTVPGEPSKGLTAEQKRELERQKHNEAIKLAVDAEQNYLLYYLPEILNVASSERQKEDNDVTNTFKRYHSFGENNIKKTAMNKSLEFFSRGKNSAIFSRIPNSILSSLLPDVKLFKVFHDGKTKKEFNWQIPFTDHVDESDINKIFTSRVGIIRNAILRSFSYEYIGKDFFTTDRAIKCKIEIIFDSVDKLLEEIDVPVPQGSSPIPTDFLKFKFADLVMNSQEAISNKNDENFYKIRALVGFKIPENDVLEEMKPIFQKFSTEKHPIDKETFIKAINETKVVLTLTHIGHDLQFNDDGTITFILDYTAFADSMLNDVGFDVLLVNPQTKQKVLDLVKEVTDLQLELSSLESCYNNIQEEAKKTLARQKFETNSKAIAAKIDSFQDNLDLETINIKSSFLESIYKSDPPVMYEVLIDARIKSAIKAISEAKTLDSSAADPSRLLDKTESKPSSIKKITNKNESLEGILKLYKDLQNAQEAEINSKAFLAKEQSSIAVEKQREIAIIREGERQRKEYLKQENNQPRGEGGAGAFRGGAAIAGDLITTQQLENVEAKFKSREEEAKKKVTDAQAKQKRIYDSLQNDLSKVIDLSGTKTKFILLGDLLNIALRCLDNNEQLVENTDKPAFLLGLSSILYKNINEKRRAYIREQSNATNGVSNYTFDAFSSNVQFDEIVFGMQNFPISINRLTEFFVEKIVKQDIRAYPLVNFLRDITELVRVCSLNVSSAGTNSVAKLDMQQAKMTISKENFKLVLAKNKNKVIDPFKDTALLTDPELAIKNNEDFISLMYFYTRGFNLGLESKIYGSNEEDDKDPSKNGIFKISLGSKVGILKKINYSKVNQAGVMEARMFSAGEMKKGNNLRMKYNAKITLFGPALFRNGDYLEIDPVILANPSVSGQTAAQVLLDQLGIGGFYMVNKVGTTISDSIFETVVDAAFVAYSTGKTTAPTAGGISQNTECAEKLKSIGIDG